MTSLATWLIRKGLSARAAKAIEWLGFLLIAVLLIAGTYTAWHRFLDDQRTGAVTLDRAEIQAAADNQVLAADRVATANQTAADAAFANDQEELHEEVVRNATVAPVGPGVQSVLARMREQQAAGRR